MYEVIAMTTKGQRENNEDCMVIGKSVIQSDEKTIITRMSEGYLAVLDGMGGLPKGEEASLTGAQALVESTSPYLYAVIQQCNEAVCRKQSLYHCSMATTIAGIHLNGDGTFDLFNAGDSMIYEYHTPFIMPISRVDTPIGEYKRSGFYMSGDTSQVTEYLGKNRVHPYLMQCIFYSGNLILICSDGLSKAVNYEQMEAIFSEKLTLEEMAKKLLEAAKNSDDNITFILVKKVN